VPHLVEVAFKGNRREFFLWEADDAPPQAAAVIVDADRGEDLGLVHSVGASAEQRSAKVPHGLFGAPATRVVKRVATADEVGRHEQLRAADDEARRKAMERVKANALVMKVTDAEWQWDRKKLTFYFTAEKRVDFRTLVRELASMFRTRIELKQIGVRDEAKRLDGIGRCGRQYCSASWLPELRPVNLGVAKDQRLSLNPSQISGACGRLMCCLRYEHDFYVKSRKKYPKEGKVVRTSRTEEKVIANDIFRERVTLRGVDGEMRTIALADLRAEMLEAQDPLVAALDAAARDVVSGPSTADEVEEQSAFDVTYTDEYPVQLAVRPAAPVPDRPPRVSRPSGGGASRATPAAVRASDELPKVESEPGLDETGEHAAATDGERRPQRRRGRRGGRRNRPSGGTNVAPSDDSAAGSGDVPSGE
jgi:cell fate regulator YaaT (PSP1 superfamily)